MTRKYKSRAKKYKRSKIRKNRSRLRTRSSSRSRKIKRYLGGMKRGAAGGKSPSQDLIFQK